MRSLLIVLLAGAVLLPSCTRQQYAARADKTAYRTLADGRRVAVGEPGDFDITYRPIAREPAPTTTAPADNPAATGPAADTQPAAVSQPAGDQGDLPELRIGTKIVRFGEAPPEDLSLEECLQVAFRNSRALQTRKEQLYSQALELANAARGWDVPLFGGPSEGLARRTRTEKNGPEVEGSRFTQDFSLVQQLRNGGALGLGITLDVLNDLTSLNSTSASSLVSANFTQPLLRGAWGDIAYEGQYRLGRDFLISLYEYERFRQELASQIAVAYYGLLRRRDQLANDQANIARLEYTLELTRERVRGGDVSAIQQDQAQQDLLDARSRQTGNQKEYANRLDDFKIRLGLPVLASLDVDYPGELDRLRQDGLHPPAITADQAMAAALHSRPDVLSQRAVVRDAARDVDLAANDFLPGLGLEFGVNAPGQPKRSVWAIRTDRNTRTAAVGFDYDLDQTNHRDAYRNAMLAHQQALRDYDEFADSVRLDVLRNLRELERAQVVYQIQEQSLVVALRRQTLAQLEQSKGQASARDVLEAESALIGAQNAATDALVSYLSTRLAFLTSLGLLEVGPDGLIAERPDAVTFERIVERYDYLQP